MPKKKKAARPRAGRTAKKEKLNLSSIIIVPGDWSKALFDWQVGGSHVPTSVLLAAQSLVGRACIKCGRPARFTCCGTIPGTGTNGASAKSTVLIGLCTKCVPTIPQVFHLPVELDESDASTVWEAVQDFIAPFAPRSER